MDRPNSDIDVETDDIDRWYFFPYTEYEEYEPDDPLYALVAVFEEVGDVVIYNRPGTAGTYHTTDPNDTTAEIHPPTDAFKTAFAKILTNPGETVDISEFVSDMEPWEHHQLEILLMGLNNNPGQLPVEVRKFVNDILDEMMEIEITGGEATDTEFKKFMEMTEEHYFDMDTGPSPMA